MIVIEADMGGQRKMLSALSATETYACDTFDLAAIDGLNQFAESGELLAAMRILSRQDFLRLLHSLQGHPRITFGKSVPVEISSLHHRPKVVLERGTGDEISLRLVEEDKERLLVGQTESWFKSGNRFVSLAEGLPAEFLSLASGPLVLRGERALRFLALDAPRLKHWFEVETAAGLLPARAAHRDSSLR